MATTSFQLGVKTEKYLLILPELIQSSFKGDDRLGGDDLLWQTVPGLCNSVCEVVPSRLRWRNLLLPLFLYSFIVRTKLRQHNFTNRIKLEPEPKHDECNGVHRTGPPT